MIGAPYLYSYSFIRSTITVNYSDILFIVAQHSSDSLQPACPFLTRGNLVSSVKPSVASFLIDVSVSHVFHYPSVWPAYKVTTVTLHQFPASCFWTRFQQRSNGRRNICVNFLICPRPQQCKHVTSNMMWRRTSACLLIYKAYKHVQQQQLGTNTSRPCPDLYFHSGAQ